MKRFSSFARRGQVFALMAVKVLPPPGEECPKDRNGASHEYFIGKVMVSVLTKNGDTLDDRIKQMGLVVSMAFMFVMISRSPVLAGYWEFQDSGTTENLYDICFVDEYHGWAVGGKSTIIRTTDGGNTWERLDYTEEGFTFKCVEFVNVLTGYMIGDDWSAENPTYTYKVLYTRDGGVSWEDRTPSNEDYAHFRDLAVIDENTCWVTAELGIRGRILHTKDGGKSWEIQYIDQHSYPHTFHGIDFIDYDTGWALNAIYSDMYGPTYCYKTENGGAEWTEIEMGARLDQNKIYAVNEEIIWACNFLIQLSRDGGYTWSLGDEVYHDLVRDVYPINELKAYVLWTDRLDYTEDGGKSFNTVFVDDTEKRTTFNSIDGINGKHIWCTKITGEILKYTIEETSVENTVPLPQTPLVTIYPNPFNASTEISFDLDRQDSVELVVYDILGRKMTTLMNGNLPPGNYSYQWNGASSTTNSSASSGVYFAVLKTSRDVVTKKMLLLR